MGQQVIPFFYDCDVDTVWRRLRMMMVMIVLLFGKMRRARGVGFYLGELRKNLGVFEPRGEQKESARF